MTLDKVKRGQLVKIISIPNELVRAQAIRFGIAEGAVVACQEIVPAGPVVISRHKQEIAIGRSLARNIKVEPVMAAPEIFPQQLGRNLPAGHLSIGKQVKDKTVHR